MAAGEPSCALSNFSMPVMAASIANIICLAKNHCDEGHNFFAHNQIVRKPKGKGSKAAKGSGEPKYPQFGERIARARQRLSPVPTQEAVAEKLNLTRQAYGAYENGISCPIAADVPALCKELQMTVSEFYGETPDAMPPPRPDIQLEEIYGLWENIDPDGRDLLVSNARRFANSPEGGLKKSGTS